MCLRYTFFFLLFIILTTPANAKKKYVCAVQSISVHLHNPVVGQHFTAPQPLPHFATKAKSGAATAVAAIIPTQANCHITVHNVCNCGMVFYFLRG